VVLISKKDFLVALDGKDYATLAQAKAAAAPVIAYGAFINAVVNFLIVAFVVFLLVKQANRLRKPAAVIAGNKGMPILRMNIPVKASRCPECTSDLKIAA
jgi:large conductance mechanosensitive channel